MTEQSHAIFQRMGEKLVRFRWLSLLLVVALTAGFFFMSQGLTFNGSTKIWFVDNDPAMNRLDVFKQQFGNDHFVYLMLEPNEEKGIFKKDTVTSLRNLAGELEREVPFLKDMTWVGNAEAIDPTSDGIHILRLFEDDVPEDQNGVAARGARALQEEDFVGRYISADGNTAAIMLEMSAYPADAQNPEAQVASTVYKILGKHEFSGLKSWVVGEPAFMFNYNMLAGKETPMLFGICILIQLALLALLTRTVRSSLVPLLIVVLSVLWTFGVIGLTGLQLNLMIIGLPVILICVGIGDAVHVIVAFNERYQSGVPRKEAVKEAIANVGLPCLLTTLTTAAGFFSFIAAPIKPFQEMALYVPGGVIAALVLTFLLVPFFFSFGREHPKKITARAKRKKDLFDRMFVGLAEFVINRPKQIVACFSVFFVFGLVAANFVQIETNTTRLLKENVPMRQAIEHVDNTMGGSMALEVILDTKKENGVRSAAFLHKMELLEKSIEEHELVTDVTSVLDALRKVRRGMHSGSEAYYSLPEEDRAVSDYLLLYEMAGGDQLDKMLSFDGSIARINARTSALGTAEARLLRQAILKQAEALFPDGSVRVDTTGSVDLSVALTDNIATGQNSSFALAFSVIGLIMIWAMRSVKLGMISILPNVFPVLMVLGLLGITGIYMDTVLMSVSAMIIGVAVDDTIHFFIRLRREFEKTGEYESAVRETIIGAGRPLMFTTITLALGFGVLMISAMMGWVKIGALAGFAFVCALLADLLLAPALVLLLKPFDQNKA